MNTSQRGAWAEAIASAHLLQQGYEVFQGIGNASCDILALKDGVAERVEVKAATHSPGSTNRPSIWVGDRAKFDKLLVVMPDGEVLENPTRDRVYGAEPGKRRSVAV